ncbi:hypothetical protein ACFL5A_04315 [Gemmatimonadota bacterium]
MFGRKDLDSAWRSRFPDIATCIRCLQGKDVEEMDRLLWCRECRETARRRSAVWGWGIGTLLSSGLALWIWIYIQPSDLVLGGWIATVVAALWIGGRVAREIAYGIMRFQNRHAAEAVPPTHTTDPTG